MTKPGGYLCFTNFIEPGGEFIGTILQPIEKSFWSHLAEKYFLVDLKIKRMIHQHDRYYVRFSKHI